MSYHLEVIYRKSKTDSNHQPIVCVHGAAVGAWFFKDIQDFFSHHGYDSFSLSLRGHGASDGYDLIDTFTLDDYVDDVLSVINLLDQKPIVIGHSMGGAILQKLMSKHHDLIDHAILISSPPPSGIDESSKLGLFFSDARQFLRKERKDHPDQVITFDDLLNRFLFNQKFKEEELQMIKAKLSKESSLVKKDLLNPFISTYDENIKVDVIGSYQDQIIPYEKIKETADFYHKVPYMLNGLCHLMPIDPLWESLAQLILTIISSK